MKRNLLAARILCALLTAFTSLSASAATYDFVQNGIYYTITSTSTTVKTVSVTCKYNGPNGSDGKYNDADTYSGVITIPSEVDYDGVSYTVTQISGGAFNGCTSLTEVILPDGITAIGDSSFFGCTGLTRCNIPETVQKIGGSSFSGCQALTTMSIPEGITKIPYGLFRNCTNLTSVSLPGSVTDIDSWSFGYCTSLKSIDLPASLKFIGISAFFGCSGLENIEIPEGITTINNMAFHSCSNLKTVKLPSTITAINICAFRDCSALETINFPEGLEKIGEMAFLGCESLTDIYLDKNVKNIDYQAFGGDSRPKIITVLALEPPVAQSVSIFSNQSDSAFTPWQYANTDLRVPYESIEKYRTAPVWENFFKDRNPLTGIEDVEAADGAELDVVERYDLSGRPVADDYRGITVVRRTDGSVAKEIRR